MDNSFKPKVSTSYSGLIVAGSVVVLLGFGGLGVWAATARLDSAVIAPGRVAVESNRKQIQHLEGGIVREIRVKAADRVKAGDALAVLDDVSAKAALSLAQEQYDQLVALDARLVAERAGTGAIVYPDSLLERARTPSVQMIIADQNLQFTQRVGSLNNQISILETQISQQKELIAGLTDQISAMQEQAESFDEELAIVKPAAEKGNYSKNQLRALQRERSSLSAQIAESRANMARAGEAIAEAQLQIEQTRKQFIEDVAENLRQARGLLVDAREKLVVALDRMERIVVRAPIDGVVQNMQIHTVGGVIRPGDVIMEIVPVNDDLIVNANISPMDIDVLRTGMTAEVRFSSFASREIPTIFGTVETISADTLYDEAQREDYYLAKVRVDQSSVPDNLKSHLTPGMPADVIVATGERTALDYIITPLQNRLIKAMREE